MCPDISEEMGGRGRGVVEGRETELQATCTRNALSSRSAPPTPRGRRVRPATLESCVEHPLTRRQESEAESLGPCF